MLDLEGWRNNRQGGVPTGGPSEVGSHHLPEKNDGSDSRIPIFGDASPKLCPVVFPCIEKFPGQEKSQPGI